MQLFSSSPVTARMQRPQREQREDAWPGEREPASSDAQIAYQTLPVELMSVFKQAIQADVQAREQKQLLSPENVQALLQQSLAPDSIPWPSAFFFAAQRSSHASPGERLESLVQACHSLFLHKSPFLKNVPATAFFRTKRPEYLTLAMASMGAVLTHQSRYYSLELWHTAAKLLIGNIDVDNSLSRKTDLVKAWILLETFSLLCPDREVWRQNNIIHACVKTAVWRTLLEAPYLDHASRSATDAGPLNSKTEHGRSIIAYFLLVDLLRAVQQGQLASFPTTRFLESIQPQNQSTMPYSSMAPPTGEHFGDLLIPVLSLLADVHLLTMAFVPLAYNASDNEPTTQSIPYTLMFELNKLKDQLNSRQLDWIATHAAIVPADVLLLYHFSRLYSMVPQLQTLFVVSGYTPPSFGTAYDGNENSDASSAAPEYSAAMPVVWKILETSELMQTDELPIWAPLSVFSAGLVLWARTRFSPSDGLDAWSARSFIPFQQELARMDFPCVQQMVSTLVQLGSVLATR